MHLGIFENRNINTVGQIAEHWFSSNFVPMVLGLMRANASCVRHWGSAKRNVIKMTGETGGVEIPSDTKKLRHLQIALWLWTFASCGSRHRTEPGGSFYSEKLFIFILLFAINLFCARQRKSGEQVEEALI